MIKHIPGASIKAGSNVVPRNKDENNYNFNIFIEDFNSFLEDVLQNSKGKDYVLKKFEAVKGHFEIFNSIRLGDTEYKSLSDAIDVLELLKGHFVNDVFFDSFNLLKQAQARKNIACDGSIYKA